jgi:transposase-like protein
MKKKTHGNQKYSPELIKKAVALYKKGKLSMIDVCEHFGIQSTTTLRYHLNPKNREKIKKSYQNWRKNNLESNRRKMREYAQKKRKNG